MANIITLIPDIYKLVQSEKGWFDEQCADALSTSMVKPLGELFNTERFRPEGNNTLRMSSLGPRCPRALWYSVHHPEMAHALPPWTEVKFAFGTIIEALALTLARAAGHDVTGEQDELTLDGIVGHRDAVIDGCVVDVKSCSSYQFAKFKSGSVEQNDSFGYLDQLSGYVVASSGDPLVTVKDRGYILAVDKVLGHMVLHEKIIRDPSTIRERIAYYKQVVGNIEPPSCECRTVPVGASGNRKLGVPASYSPYKYCCFPGLRTFLYAEGPVYLTKVGLKPNVPEIKKDGKYVW